MKTQEPQDRNEQKPSSGDEYRRNATQLGATASDTEKDTSGTTRKGGGGSGYDAGEEQKQINTEREKMHNERDKEQLNPERTQTPQPETDPGRESPDKTPDQSSRPEASSRKNIA